MRTRVAAAILVFVAGCSNGGGSGFQSTGDAAAPGLDARGSDATAPRDAGMTLGSPDGTLGGSADAATGDPVVYGHSATTLYAVNPTTKAVTKVADFSGCDDDVIDIALDKSSVMYGTTTDAVYTIDTTTAACHLIANGSYPNSLSFVPAGTLDPNVEALVGYNGSTYVRIDTTTGAVTDVGSLSNEYASSGDIVSVIGGGTYLTVTGGDDCLAEDCLVEVDPKTGSLVKNYGSVGYSAVYGLAFWAGTVYGFDDEGDLFQVDFPTGGGLMVSAIPIPNAPDDLSFYGAGSTTSAPPVATSK